MPPQQKPPPRTCRIEVQFSQEEKRQAEAVAADLGVPVATVLRLAFKQWAAEREPRVA
jgi:antitoxin component of RelBE/YafQ-DinJ toxin-antitoxin module